MKQARSTITLYTCFLAIVAEGVLLTAAQPRFASPNRIEPTASLPLESKSVLTPQQPLDLFCMAQSTSSQPGPNTDQLPAAMEGQTWQLVWHDEFDGTKLDPTKWEVPDTRRRDGWWSPKAVALDGSGRLALRTIKEGDRYLDACIRTRGKFEHTYGYYVARIQLQSQPGHWSAFWLFNSSVNKLGNAGRDGTEIDIYEKPWLDDRVQHALHWDGYGKEHKSEGKVSKIPGIMDGFHTFALWWRPDMYIFYVDGNEVWRTEAGGVCQVPLYIKLSDEIGPWGGKIQDAKLPDQFVIDYVRVYDLVDRTPDGD